jgi:PTH1 family peptidyl-tRNA hydrolase
MRSIIATMDDRFPRLRIGVGRPEFDSIDHVLSPFSTEESARLPALIDAAAEAVLRWLDEGTGSAMQYVNNLEIA